MSDPLAGYFKSNKPMARLTPETLGSLYKMANFRILNGLEKHFQFLFLALGDQFHPAIGKVPDHSGDLKTLRQGLDCVTEPYALHPTRKE